MYIKLITTVVIVISSITLSQDFWEHTSGPFGGTILSFAENSEQELFAGTRWDLVFKSEDFGLNWTHLDNGFINPYFTPSIDKIAINDSDHIFIAGYGTGVYRSLDNGESWQQLSNGMYRYDIYALIIDQNGFIYAGISRGNSVNVLRSTDNGESWENKSSGLGNSDDPMDFAIDNNNRIFAATFSGGVYYSTDNGENWLQTTLTDKNLLSISINEDDHIFTGDWYNNKIYRSSDGGISWDTLGVSDDTHQNIEAIVTDTPGYIFAGTTGDPRFSKGVFRSSDNGESWIQVNNGLTDLNISSLFVDYELNLYVGTYYGGGFKSTDLGETWNQIGPIISQINDLIIDENDIIYVGTENRVYRSTNFGDSWQYSSDGISSISIQSLAYNINGDIWAGARYYSGGIFRSTDKGLTWEGAGINIIPTSINIDDSGHVFASSFRDLYRTTDNGMTWTILNVPTYRLLLITPDQTFYLGGAGLYRSFDRGNSWIKIFNANITVIYIDGNGNIFAGSDSESGGLYRSTDNGANWESIDSGFLSKRIIAINGMKNSGIYCAVGYGSRSNNYAYYVSYDMGDNWIEINAGISSSGVSLEFDSNGFLYAGTSKRGVFRSVEIATDVKSISNTPSTYLLLPNYPNPFNPTTVISYQIPQRGFVTLKIFDLLGKEVATLVNEEKPAGKYEVDFSAKGLASGVYIYRMKVNDFIESKKMILLR